MQMLENFSLSEIIVFTILFVLALKECISIIDWFKQRNQKFFYENHQKPEQLEKTVQELKDAMQKLTKNVDMLIQSDKDAIKSFIVKQHHFFCYEKKEIDLQNLDCIEKRYNHYKEEGGNSYIETLMKDLRELPKNNNF